MKKENLDQSIKMQRSFFNTGKTKNLNFRKKYLVKLRQSIINHKEDIYKALQMDLNKSKFETYETEIGLVFEEINYMLKNMDKFSAPKCVKTPISHFPSISKIYKEPYGIVLIMSPWNYPFQLTLVPLIGAIAAGNCAVVKPSNYSPATSAILKKIITKTFNEQHVMVVEGGRDANQDLLKQKFNYIFFTGSTSVGKVVMSSAAENLTPITLELGGKSPCIVDENANIPLAGKRIAWGKFLNAGQTCVAPDYILVHKSVKYKLIKEIERSIKKFYGKTPWLNKDYPKIINEKHFNRLINLTKDEDVIVGGQFNSETNQIAPTILDNVTWRSAVMQEEIFGPLLPIITFNDIKIIPTLINNRPKPLALYLFTTSEANEKFILDNISFGGGCINDTIVHLATSYMPFGGVGESGMGSYHGKKSFNTFSHSKSILKKSNLLDIPLRYPPFNKINFALLKQFLK